MLVITMVTEKVRNVNYFGTNYVQNTFPLQILPYCLFGCSVLLVLNV